jgi:hypothetical protein
MSTAKAQYPSNESINAAALTVGCEPNVIRAIATVESGPYGAFLETGEPVILFEPHIFSRLTKGKYDWYTVSVVLDVDGPASIDPPNARWRVLSRPVWTPKTYGPVSVQHLRLAAAAQLDRDAALQSASWGLFQILGTNYKRAGHETLQSFINAAYRSVDDHLAMLVSFILTDPRLLKAVRDKQWLDIARYYNGTGQVNLYGPRLAFEVSSVVTDEPQRT